MTLSEIRAIYDGSDGDATKDLYGKLQRRFGNPGLIAVSLFRLAKKHGRHAQARPRLLEKTKDSLDWAVYEAVEQLAFCHHELKCGTWGWKVQGRIAEDRFHFLVDIPTGQCCFRLKDRSAGKDYAGDYRPGNSALLIFKWIDQMFNPRVASTKWTGARPLDLGD